MLENMERQPELGTDTTQNLSDIPQPRERSEEAAAPQATTHTEPGCTIDPSDLQHRIDEQRMRLRATAVEALGKMGTQLSEFLKD